VHELSLRSRPCKELSQLLLWKNAILGVPTFLAFPPLLSSLDGPFILSGEFAGGPRPVTYFMPCFVLFQRHKSAAMDHSFFLFFTAALTFRYSCSHSLQCFFSSLYGYVDGLFETRHFFAFFSFPLREDLAPPHFICLSFFRESPLKMSTTLQVSFSIFSCICTVGLVTPSSIVFSDEAPGFLWTGG